MSELVVPDETADAPRRVSRVSRLRLPQRRTTAPSRRATRAGRRETTAPARRPSPTAERVAFGLMLVVVLAGTFCAYVLGLGAFQADRAQKLAYTQITKDLKDALVPVSAPIEPGTPVAVLRIPAIGLDQVVFQGASSAQTRSGPGHRSDTVLPGQAGVSVIEGHRSTLGAAFAHLGQVRPGDGMVVTTGQGTFHFRVDMVRTSDAPATKIPQVASRLSLVTSDPVLVPNRTLVVSGTLVGKEQPAAATSVAAADEAPGHGSSSRLVDLLLWAQLLLLVAGVATWAALRLPQRVVWLVATPVLLAVLWNTFAALAVLLPNTL